MRRTLWIGLSAVLMLGGVWPVEAQLIRYDRRRSQTSTARPKTPPPAAETRGLTAFERRFDRNRNGRLDADEVRTMLRDVVKTVGRRGRVAVDSRRLKAYDVDGDGYLDRYEVRAIQRELR